MGSGCCIGDFNCCIGDIDLPCLFDCCVGNSCCVGHSSGPSKDELHAKKIANELAEMKEKMSDATSKQENKIMEYINKSMNLFMKEVDELNKESFGGETLSINVKMIKNKNESLKKQVIGCVGNVMNARLVSSDKELSIILAEYDDKKRKKNFDNFVKKIKKEALSEFKIEIERTVKEQSNVVSSEIKSRQREVNKRLEETISELTSIMEIKKKNTEDIEKKQIKYMYQSALCDILMREIKE
ncbi:MAG: hypothetical protein J6A03_09950 [Lachnospiraceae bacterium]|nr:hypothetical protein [Lachnospiraceae bacterium]